MCAFRNYYERLYRRRKERIMEINYIAAGDYFLPAIKLSDPSDALPLGLYGELRKRHLKQRHPILYSKLLLSEKLYEICREVDSTAQSRMATIANREVAHEVILSELVYN
jgi:hypothetical protein